MSSQKNIYTIWLSFHRHQANLLASSYCTTATVQMTLTSERPGIKWKIRIVKERMDERFVNQLLKLILDVYPLQNIKQSISSDLKENEISGIQGIWRYILHKADITVIIFKKKMHNCVLSRHKYVSVISCFFLFFLDHVYRDTLEL